MQDFPPRTATFFSGSDAAPSPDPDTRTPAAFLRWVLGQQKGLIALSGCPSGELMTALRERGLLLQ